MKLALCLFTYFPYGGLQRNFLTIAQELVERGHDVTVYTGVWEGDCPAKLKVEVLPVKGITNHGKNRHYVKALQSALKQQPVDLVIGFNKMPGLDVYYCADTCFATKAYQQKGWLYRLTPRCRWSLKYERAVYDINSSTQILLLSAIEGEAFQHYYGTQAERLHLMPPGINRSRVWNENSGQLRAKLRAQLDIHPEQRLLAFVGSDYRRKGLDRVLVALASLPKKQLQQACVLIIGRDKNSAIYEALAAKLGVADKVIFYGQTDEVSSLLFASDCLLHPAYSENTGNVILEGVVAGLPVICSDICGYAFYIRDNLLGEVVPEPFVQTALNDSLLNVLNSTRDWRSHAATFAAEADIYSRPQRIADTIESIFAHQH